MIGWALAAAASAASPAATPWVVLNRGHQCTIARSFRTPDGEVTAQFGMAPGIEPATLLLTVPAIRTRDLPRKISVTLGSNAGETASIGWYAVDDARVSIGQTRVARTTIEQLTLSPTLQIDLDQRSYLLASGAAPRAVAAFRDCLDTLLRGWGGDPLVQNPASPPEWTNYYHVLKGLRFPYRGTVAERDGRTRIRLKLDAKGDVTACDPLLQVGVTEYLVTACKTLRRLHARPARLNGRDVPYMTTLTVAWQLVDGI